MVKRGSPFLKFLLVNLAISFKNHNAIFKRILYKKINDEKNYEVTINHVV